jgi:hypothetical protein
MSGMESPVPSCDLIDPVEPAALDGVGKRIERSLLLAACCIKLCGEDLQR